MSHTFQTENLKQLFSYPFKDERWQGKLIVASALMFAGFIVPVLPMLALYGYVARIMRRIISGDGKLGLPEWEDWGDLLGTGLKVLGPMIIFTLPALLLMFLSYATWFFPVVFAGLAAESGDLGPQSFLVLLSILSTGMGFVLFGVAMLVGLFLGILQPVIMTHVVATGEFAAAFRFYEWWRIFRSNREEFLLAYALIVGLSVGLGFLYQAAMLTVVLCCILPFLLPIASVYLLLVMAPLFAQAYRIALEVET